MMALRLAYPRVRRMGLRRASASAAAVGQSTKLTWAQQFRTQPVAYMTIPVVAAAVGFVTNWAGVKMLFYPLEYFGVDLYRAKDSPWGVAGWQGVVPTKAEPMGRRLVDIITTKLLRLPEAFERLEPSAMARLLHAPVIEAIRRDCGAAWAVALGPVLPWALCRVVRSLQRDVESVLDVERVVLSAFRADVGLLVELFEEVGRVELKFLVESGLVFGFALGLAQMGLWLLAPKPWTLPVAGAVVGYVTNWLAIKMIFEPVEPLKLLPVPGPMQGLFTVQGLFTKRQPEVSDEFAKFLEERVLTPQSLLVELTTGRLASEFDSLLRKAIPFVVPDAVVRAAKRGLVEAAKHPDQHPQLHEYIKSHLALQPTLSHRLKQLSPPEFEDLLHPVFQEDEITLIIVGGVLGAAAGGVQYVFGWGGPARRLAVPVVAYGCLMSLFIYK
ncbi:hypothetical protein B484DRAFT_446502 [Ochromonadaceae sp. CCMP2298]|nr:hypothetical protein B484DRAFT_446502 [Ochromonadaceae sp. CCMP2298]